MKVEVRFEDAASRGCFDGKSAPIFASVNVCVCVCCALKLLRGTPASPPPSNVYFSASWRRRAVAPVHTCDTRGRHRTASWCRVQPLQRLHDVTIVIARYKWEDGGDHRCSSVQRGSMRAALVGHDVSGLTGTNVPALLQLSVSGLPNLLFPIHSDPAPKF